MGSFPYKYGYARDREGMDQAGTQEFLDCDPAIDIDVLRAAS